MTETRPQLPNPVGNWVQELAFEVALEYFAPEDLMLKFDLTRSQYERIVTTPAFRKVVGDYRKEIDDEGIAFRLRARKAAEDVLSELHAMAFNQAIDAKDRLKAIELICRYAGFEMKKEDADGGIKLQIYTNLNMKNDPGQTYTIEVPEGKVA